MNILYTLSGFGFGHASRTKIMVEMLKSFGHQVKIATYGQSVEYLKNFFSEDIIEIKGVKNKFSGCKLSTPKTAMTIIKNSLVIIGYNSSKFKKIVKNFKIDLIFNDFEPMSRWFARTSDIPLITIDNQSLMHFCKIDVPTKFKKDAFPINIMMSVFFPWGDWRFITSFAPELTPLKKRFSPNSFIVPPPLRSEIFNLKPEKKDFILVYQTVPVYKKELFKIFSKINEKFVCYNLGKQANSKNIIFKDFSASGFLQDLANCKAVIINGGFTAMSEAIYLKKPIFSIPIKSDFEQALNGIILEKTGYGVFCQDLNEKALKNFLDNLNIYEKKLENYQQDKNEVLKKKLLRVLKKIEIGEWA